MASVYLNFIPPNDVPDLVALHIYEAPAQNGPFSEIEAVTSVGSPGAYITAYTTDQALSETDWFAIQWENSKGAFSELSSAIQGGTTNVVSEIVERVMLRDPTLKEQIVAQEAEAVVWSFYGANPPPLDEINPKTLSGLTLLTMAQCYIVRISAGIGTTTSYTAGLITQKTDTHAQTASMDTIRDLVAAANSLLGRSFSIVALMPEVESRYGGNGSFNELVGADTTRAIVEFDVGVLPRPKLYGTTALYDYTGGMEPGGEMGEQIPQGGDTGDVLRRSGPEQLAWTSPPYVLSRPFTFSQTTTAGDPGSGKFRLNNATLAAATFGYFSHITQDGIDWTASLEQLAVGQALRIQDKNDATKFARYTVASLPVDNGTWITVGVVFREGGGAFSNNSVCQTWLLFDSLAGQA